MPKPGGGKIPALLQRHLAPARGARSASRDMPNVSTNASSSSATRVRSSLARRSRGLWKRYSTRYRCPLDARGSRGARAGAPRTEEARPPPSRGRGGLGRVGDVARGAAAAAVRLPAAGAFLRRRGSGSRGARCWHARINQWSSPERRILSPLTRSSEAPARSRIGTPPTPGPIYPGAISTARVWCAF